jgi:UMP-CMP kinase
MDQAQIFEETVCPSKLTLFFDCPEEVLRKRLLNRGKTSGRVDDNEASIMKRFKTFIETSMPVVDYYQKQGKVVKISAIPPPEAVYEDVKLKFKERGIYPPKNSETSKNL